MGQSRELPHRGKGAVYQEQLKQPDLNHQDLFERRLDGVLVSKEEIVPR
jgi:hypothetical protein